ncbi:MAG: CpaF family protein [Chloroflexi bacterium]|nr:MAG: CpaF family protein [Chloroflexota bacterium]
MSPVWINAYRHGSVAATLAELQSMDLSLVEDARSLAGHDYGPITPLLNDDSISEVMVNGPSQVYIERNGQLIQAEVAFAGEEELVRVIREIAAFVGRRVDDDSPMVDARLPDGSRVNAIIPPLALDGASLTIRKFSRDPYTVADLVSFGTLTAEAAAFLEACVRARFNVLVSGGTGSGKTTTLNVLSSFIPDNERVVTIEDAAELQLRQPHKVRLESRPARIDGTGRITIRDLVVNSLRMRPDRIVIGECRSGEALDMLQAMNTGHDGSLTTIHANSPRDTLARLETLVLMSGVDLPQRAIREQIASAIQLIVQQSRLRDGSRRITNVTEIVGREGDTITLQDVFLFEETGLDGNGRITGKLNPTGIRPNAMARIYSKRIPIAPALSALYPDRKAPDFTVGVRR